MPSLQTLQYVYSTLGSDLDLACSVEKFVEELPRWVEMIRAEVDQQDWHALGCLSHQITGSCQSYGFEKVAELSAQVEANCLNPCNDIKILSAVDKLLDICGRVRAGAPD